MLLFIKDCRLRLCNKSTLRKCEWERMVILHGGYSLIFYSERARAQNPEELFDYCDVIPAGV